MPQGHVLERAAAVAAGDQRAVETFNELVTVQWEHARAVARERLLVGTREHGNARAKVEELERLMTELERTLHERPWTEV